MARKETLAYLKNLIRDRSVASIAPTSKFAINRICAKLDPSKAKTVVEFGPGLGCFTRKLLELLPSDAELIAFETNPRFVRALRRDLKDPRLTVIADSAERVVEVLQQRGRVADYIISGIPFSLIPEAVKDRILAATAEALAEQGRFFTYQTFPPAARFDRVLKRPMERYFRVQHVEYELRNVPPLRIYEAEPIEHGLGKRQLARAANQ